MWLDLLGTGTSLLSTYYYIRLDKKAWLIGLLATLLNACLYLQKGIYADMVLEIFYFFSLGYGWLKWSTPQELTASAIKPMGIFQWLNIVSAIGLLFIVIDYLLYRFTPTTIPHLDALTTSCSLIAQLLMSHKMIATWILWGIADFLYITLYAIKGLPLHTGLMMLYTGMAVVGYYQWKKKSSKTQASTKGIAGNKLLKIFSERGRYPNPTK